MLGVGFRVEGNVLGVGVGFGEGRIWDWRKSYLGRSRWFKRMVNVKGLCRERMKV